MSGEKISYTRLRTDEYDRLMQSARQQDNLEQETRQHLQNEFNQQYSSMQNRHRRLENSLS